MRAVTTSTKAGSPAPAKRKRISSIDRILQVFDHLRQNNEPASAYAISKATGAPVSTIYATIDELVQRNLLVRRTDNTVWLGPRLYYYGLSYARSIDFREEARREMDALCRDVGETVQVCGRDGDNIVVLEMAKASGHFRVSTDVGVALPLNWSASGLLLVGYLPEEERREIFARSARPSPTGLAETDPDRLAAQAAAAFEARLAIQKSMAEHFVCCVAAPLRDPSGACVATISIVLSQSKLEQEPQVLAAAVQAAAARIEQRLGWHGS
jgi:DNA-binding IclR family transcriptional regulator